MTNPVPADVCPLRHQLDCLTAEISRSDSTSERVRSPIRPLRCTNPASLDVESLSSRLKIYPWSSRSMFVPSLSNESPIPMAVPARKKAQNSSTNICVLSVVCSIQGLTRAGCHLPKRVLLADGIDTICLHSRLVSRLRCVCSLIRVPPHLTGNHLIVYQDNPNCTTVAACPDRTTTHRDVQLGTRRIPLCRLGR